MEKEFAPYELAVKLKALGFNEPCFGFYLEDGTWTPASYSRKGTVFPSNTDLLPEWCAAPLYQQVFRWIREKHNLRGFIGFRPNVKQFDCHIYDMSLSAKEYVKQRTLEEFNKDPKFETYEEAELACLTKLIELLKEYEDTV